MSNLPPGRELDALVAEGVFGAKITRSHMVWRGRGERPVEWDRYKADIKLWKPCCPAMEDRSDESSYFDVPEFSTDIAAAWEVVEHWEWGVQIFKGRDSYTCVLTVPEGDDLFGQVDSTGDTAPHAICLAALKAIQPTQD